MLLFKMWIPLKTKYKKHQKGRVGLSSNQSCVDVVLDSGIVAVVAKESGFVQPGQLESFRKVIVTNTKRRGRVWPIVFPDITRSAKPKESRMGHGKGNFSHWVCKVKTGSVLFELSGLRKTRLQKLEYLAIKKLPLLTCIVNRERGL